MNKFAQVRTISKGSVLVFTLAILAMIFVLTSVALSVVKNEGFLSHRYYAIKQARTIAEGGIDYAIQRLNLGGAYDGSSNVSLGVGQFTVSVTGSGGTRTIESTGYVPNASQPFAQKKVIVTAQLNGDNAQFFYGLQVDGGGLTLNNNSGIVGNVYSNGSIIGANATYITGDAAVAGGINDNPSLSLETSDSDEYIASINGNRDVAQSFIATASDKLSRVSFLLGKVGNPGGLITARLANDSAGKPSASSIASTTITGAIGDTPSWINASFDVVPNVTAGSKYWLILDTNTSSPTDYWVWRKDATTVIPNSASYYSSNWTTGSASWTSTGGNLDYRVWFGGFITKIDKMIIGSPTSGTARANSFTNTKVHGTNCPNSYCIVENPPSEPLPISDGVVTDWKNEATAGGTQGTYTLSGTGSLGPTKINGDLIVSNGSILTVTGTLYVTGNITFSNNCHVNLDPSYGHGTGIIITDGNVIVSNNCIFQAADTGSYIVLLTTKDDKSSVSMDISNNTTGVIFYAARTRINFSNNSTAREATAWGITLSNNVVITYEAGLSSVYFSSGPGAGWSVQSGTWREVAQP